MGRGRTSRTHRFLFCPIFVGEFMAKGFYPDSFMLRYARILMRENKAAIIDHCLFCGLDYRRWMAEVIYDMGVNSGKL